MRCPRPRKQRVRADAVAVDIHRKSLRFDRNREPAVVIDPFHRAGQAAVRQVQREPVAAAHRIARAAARTVDLDIAALEHLAHCPRRHQRPRPAHIALQRHRRHPRRHVVLDHSASHPLRPASFPYTSPQRAKRRPCMLPVRTRGALAKRRPQRIAHKAEGKSPKEQPQPPRRAPIATRRRAPPSAPSAQSTRGFQSSAALAHIALSHSCTARS